MNDTDAKTNSADTPQTTDLSVHGLRDPNIILPQSRNRAKTTIGSKPIEMQAKAAPVMLRSFNKDLSEAMSKKKEATYADSMSIPKTSKMPKIPAAPKAPTLSIKTPSTPEKTSDVLKQIDLGFRTRPIPPAPAPESVAAKEELVQTAEVIPKFNGKKIEKEKDFSSEIFPKPPQLPQSSKKESTKSAAPFEQKGVATVKQDVHEIQKLRVDFDRMVHGEHLSDKQDASQRKEEEEPTPQQKQPQRQPTSADGYGVAKKKENKPILSKEAVNIHVSASDLQKIKEEILNIETRKKDLQSQVHNSLEQENTLSEEKIQQELQKDRAEKQLDDILRQENEIASVIRNFEQEEKTTQSMEERHNIEKKRWEYEEKRARIEKEKWGIGGTYEKLTASLKEKEIKLEQIRSSKNDKNKEINNLLKEKQLKEIKARLGEVEQKKEDIENTQMTLLDEKKDIEKTLTLLKSNKEKVIKERQEAEENEAKVESISEKRIFEEKRQNIEIRQRSIEQQRWDAEQKREQIVENIKTANEQYRITLAMEEEIRKKL